MATMATKGDEAELPLLESNVYSCSWPPEVPADGSNWPHDGERPLTDLTMSRECMPGPDDQRKAVLCSQLKSELLSDKPAGSPSV